MQVEIDITSEPIDLRRGPPPQLKGAAGAWVEFQGVVRSEEEGRPIDALHYEAYQPMAERVMGQIVDDLSRRHQCLYVRVTHRIGAVPCGEAAIYVAVAARHREEALKMIADFMDRLKQDVPIWKQSECPPPQTADGFAHAGNSTVAHHRAANAAEVLTLLRRHCQPLGVERVAFDDALGRVLREPVRAAEDQPAFDRSSVDGYAIRLDDPGHRFEVVDEIRAGDWKPRRLHIGQCVRVATGAAIPADGLQVVMKEDVSIDGTTVCLKSRAQDRCIRYQGMDAQRGQILVVEGTTVQAGTLALMASVGHTQPLVSVLPRVLHVATGNEIVPPEESPTHGRIRDSNSALVRAFLKQWGIEPQQRRLPEEESVVRDALDRAVDSVDLLLVSGGASVGEHDFTRRLLEHLGYTVHVSKTNTRPGKPLIVAERGKSLALGLPGNPLAHYVCLNLYVRTALDGFSGRPQESVFSQGILAAAIDSDANLRETFWPAHGRRQGRIASLTPLRWHSSGDITSLATANALIRVGGGTKSLPPGSSVEFLWTGHSA